MAEPVTDLAPDDRVIWKATGKMIAGKVIGIGVGEVTVEVDILRGLPSRDASTSRYIVAPADRFTKVDLTVPTDAERWLAAL